jgi:hypothetical protein
MRLDKLKMFFETKKNSLKLEINPYDRTTFRMAITFSNRILYSICGYDLNR